MLRILYLSSCVFATLASFAQTPLTLDQCESQFLKNNLVLLAEQFNIEASRAAVTQAKIWEQPYISGEFNLVNPEANRYLDAGAQGQKALAIQQLIYLGGKKRKEVDFAKSNVAIAELQYEQLLRNLRFELRQSFYEVYFNQIKITSITEQVANLDTLVNEYSQQSQKGNIPLQNVVRLQSLSLSLKNDLLDIQKSSFLAQERLRILLNSPTSIQPIADKESIKNKLLTNLSYTEAQIQEKVLEKNPDYLTYLKIVESNELMLRWQKSIATPDVTVGANYDQRGGAFANQVNLTFGIPLPFWNKNKGNIKVAESQVSQSKLQKDQTALELKTKASNAYQTFLIQQRQYSQTANNLENSGIVYTGLLKNFQKRNVSLIEFTDFLESYTQSIMYINEIQKQLILSGETLIYLINEKVY